MTTFEAVIGLEVHVQLLTCSKMFCGLDFNIVVSKMNIGKIYFDLSIASKSP